MAFEVFKVFATLGLNTSDFDKGLDDSEKKASGFGSKVASGFATIGKTAAAGLAIAGGATVKLAKDSVDAYASFEQLAGGIETLFGEDAQTVMANADKAFKTAGLSANDYMETAIASSASMINALDGDTAKASELMDMSIIDMADNNNKLGTSMESIQNAYRGFSRGNFTINNLMSVA